MGNNWPPHRMNTLNSNMYASQYGEVLRDTSGVDGDSRRRIEEVRVRWRFRVRERVECVLYGCLCA